MSLKKGSVVTDVVTTEESGIYNFSHYKTKNIPAKGAVLRDEDTIEPNQISIFDDNFEV